tara:strand:+ start:1703 stop:1996 length:294 start_codon:yes stop_codon:yes gene_type:complete
MKFEDIKFVNTTVPDGIQALVPFGDYELSIVQNDTSYGGKNGLYEIGVFKIEDGEANSMIELPGITEPGDTVKGFLTEDGVMAIMKKMHFIAGVDAK